MDAPLVRPATDDEAQFGVIAVVYPYPGDDSYQITVFKTYIDVTGSAMLSKLAAQVLAQALLMAAELLK